MVAWAASFLRMGVDDAVQVRWFVMSYREYQYVGPPEIRTAAAGQPAGTPIRSLDELAAWLATSPTERTPAKWWIATFTISPAEVLHLAPRRSEHVACAAGGPVLSAGEMTIDQQYQVVEISNQSTGFCPEPESWTVVEGVLEHCGLQHPGGFTNPVIFRLCPACQQRNIVKDGWFYCALCDAPLPAMWNFHDTTNLK